MFQDLIGKKIRNDGFSLRETLNAHYQLVSMQYIGDYLFVAELSDGTFFRITTLPADESHDILQIVNVVKIS